MPAEVEIDGPVGDAARSKVGQAAYDLNVQQYCCAGLNFGYYYDRSPAICYDGETPPPYGMGHFTASFTQEFAKLAFERTGQTHRACLTGHSGCGVFLYKWGGS